MGVGQWLLFGQGVIEAYLSIFHAMVQVQGFLICFALGFLFTMLPRRTESDPPSLPLLVVSFACPIGTTVAAGLELWSVAQAFWLVLLVAVFLFAWPRLRRGGRRPPANFIWLIAALACGVVGSVLTGFGAAMPGMWTLHELGRGLVLQGLFCCLVVGIGGFAVPLMTRGSAPRDLGSYRESSRDLALNGLGVLLLLLSFALEHYLALRLGYALRGVTMLLALLLSAQIHRPPNRPGLIRWLLFIGIWCAPLGYLVAAAVPRLGKGGLHVTFIGGFGLLALAVSSQVILGHGGYSKLQTGRPWPLAAMAALLLPALLARMLVDLDAPSVLQWLSWGALFFLTATGCWAAYLLPRLARQPRPNEHS